MGLLSLVALTFVEAQRQPSGGTPDRVGSRIEEQFLRLDEYLAGNRIALARQLLPALRDSLDRHRLAFSEGENEEHAIHLEVAQETVTRKIDSLVQVAMAVLEQRGAEEAVAYRGRLASVEGLNDVDLGIVDEAILRFGEVGIDRPLTLVEQRALLLLDEGVDTAGMSDPEVRAVAAGIVRARADSARAAENRRDSIAQAAAARVQRDQSAERARATAARIDSLMSAGAPEEAYTVFGIYRANLEQYLPGQDYARLAARMAAQKTSHEQQVREATALADEIMAMIRAEKAARAYELFVDSRPFLAANLDQPSLAALESDVKQAHDAWRTRAGNAHSVADHVRTLIARKQADRAFQVYRENRVALVTYLEPAEFEALAAELARGHRDMMDKREWAAGYARELWLLATEGSGGTAHERFAETRDELEHYLPGPAFTALAATIEDAWTRHQVGLAKSRSAVAKIDAFLAQGRVEVAYTSLRLVKDSLERYLDTAVVADVKSRVVGAYRRKQERTASAVETRRRLWSLIEERDGPAAQALLADSGQVLEHHLDPRAFAALRGAVDQAYREFAANRARARQELTRINGLLAENRIDDAYRGLSAARDLLDRYHDDRNAFYAADRAVTAAYNQLDARRGKVDETRMRIDELLGSYEGVRAHALYMRNKVDLEKYLPTREFDTLRVAVVRGRARYEDGQVRARFASETIRALLARGAVDAAVERFEKLRPALAHFLAPADFDALRLAVAEAQRAQGGRMVEAEQVSRQVNELILNRRGKAALDLFAARRDLLAAGLDAAQLATLEQAARRGADEYARGLARATETEQAVDELLTRDSTRLAFSAFETAREDLFHYLGKERASLLGARVEGALSHLERNEGAALRQAYEINGMLGQRQGRDAAARLALHEDALRKHLPRQAYEDLRARTARAEQEYEVGYQAARETATALRALLSRDSIDAARVMFDGNRDDLSLYLGRKGFSAIEKAVGDAGRRLENNRRDARATVRRLERLAARGKEQSARTEFTNKRKHLERYLPPDQYQTAVARFGTPTGGTERTGSPPRP